VTDADLSQEVLHVAAWLHAPSCGTTPAYDAHRGHLPRPRNDRTMSFLQEGSYMSGRPRWFSPRTPSALVCPLPLGHFTVPSIALPAADGPVASEERQGGTMRLKTIGRARAGSALRSFGYYEDGPNPGHHGHEPAGQKASRPCGSTSGAVRSSRSTLSDGSRAVAAPRAGGGGRKITPVGPGRDWGPTSTRTPPGGPPPRS